MDCSMPGLPVPHHLSKIAQVHVIASVMPSNHLILWCPLLLLPSIIPSIRNFSNKSTVCIRWPKYWSFSFSISPSNEYSGWISLKIDWFNLLAVQRTLRSLLQHHSSKASILWHFAFFTVHLSQPYMTTGRTIALTIRMFVGRVMSLLFNTLSRFVICKIDSQWEFAVWLWELKHGLCGNREGWDGEGDGREVWEGGDMGVPMAGSCLYLIENNKIL